MNSLTAAQEGAQSAEATAGDIWVSAQDSSIPEPGSALLLRYSSAGATTSAWPFPRCCARLFTARGQIEPSNALTLEVFPVPCQAFSVPCDLTEWHLCSLLHTVSFFIVVHLCRSKTDPPHTRLMPVPLRPCVLPRCLWPVSFLGQAEGFCEQWAASCALPGPYPESRDGF